MNKEMNMMSDDKRRSNLRLALILASVAAMFFLGFMAKVVLLGHH